MVRPSRARSAACRRSGPHGGPDRNGTDRRAGRSLPYWKYAVRRRLHGDVRGAFPLAGSNWFPVDDAISLKDWKSLVTLLESEHRQLREAIAGFPAARLRELACGGRVTNLAIITGIAAHDIYHAGQIQLLKRLHRGAS